MTGQWDAGPDYLQKPNFIWITKASQSPDHSDLAANLSGIMQFGITASIMHHIQTSERVLSLGQ
jgi:hypothetical protein